MDAGQFRHLLASRQRQPHVTIYNVCIGCCQSAVPLRETRNPADKACAATQAVLHDTVRKMNDHGQLYCEYWRAKGMGEGPCSDQLFEMGHHCFPNPIDAFWLDAILARDHM